MHILKFSNWNASLTCQSQATVTNVLSMSNQLKNKAILCHVNLKLWKRLLITFYIAPTTNELFVINQTLLKFNNENQKTDLLFPWTGDTLYTYFCKYLKPSNLLMLNNYNTESEWLSEFILICYYLISY